ncbi:hypothetical protein [Brevundimonas sp.]|nr:hypothetical protein [Brevundimonas sp.]MDP3802700.1 hypothetical protein [Brevundimonas sp.]
MNRPDVRTAFATTASRGGAALRAIIGAGMTTTTTPPAGTG